LIDAQQAARARRGLLSAALMWGVWGFVYLISFGAFYLAQKGILSEFVAGILTAVLMVGAIVFSAVFGVRSGHGVRGPSQVVGAMYGCSWPLGFMVLTAVNVGLQNTGLTADQVTLLWSGSVLLLAGVLFMAGGALLRNWVQYGLGAWTMITGAGSIYAGVPGNFLVLSLAGGGGFLVLAGFYTWRALRASGPGRVGSGPLGINVPAL
jgi:hypothetical protein